MSNNSLDECKAKAKQLIQDNPDILLREIAQLLPLQVDKDTIKRWISKYRRRSNTYRWPEKGGSNREAYYQISELCQIFGKKNPRKFTMLLQRNNVRKIRVFKSAEANGKHREAAYDYYSLGDILAINQVYEQTYQKYLRQKSGEQKPEEQIADLTIKEWVVLYAMLMHVNTYHVWPNPEKIAQIVKKYECSVSSVRVYITNLIAKRYLIPVNEVRIGNTILRNYYATQKCPRSLITVQKQPESSHTSRCVLVTVYRDYVRLIDPIKKTVSKSDEADDLDIFDDPLDSFIARVKRQQK